MRHSIRHYVDRPLAPEAINVLQEKINEINAVAHLHIQLVTNEPRGFSGILAYGQFSGVGNYFVMAGQAADDLDERVGYYGEQLVLLAQQLGLGTCWAGVSYRKVKGTYTLAPGEKIACMIAVGHPADEGRKLKRKSVEQLSNASDDTPAWFRQGVEAARQAPTAVNQQKFFFEYLGERDGRGLVRAKRLFSMIGYTKMDLGIARLHFEIGAGRHNFEWAD